jgi:hypothetical protein
MPELLWLFLTALLHYRTSASGVALAEALETVSHDRLTRLLQGAVKRHMPPGAYWQSCTTTWSRKTTGFVARGMRAMATGFVSA